HQTHQDQRIHGYAEHGTGICRRGTLPAQMKREECYGRFICLSARAWSGASAAPRCAASIPSINRSPAPICRTMYIVQSGGRFCHVASDLFCYLFDGARQLGRGAATLLKPPSFDAVDPEAGGSRSRTRASSTASARPK